MALPASLLPASGCVLGAAGAPGRQLCPQPAASTPESAGAGAGPPPALRRRACAGLSCFVKPAVGPWDPCLPLGTRPGLRVSGPGPDRSAASLAGCGPALAAGEPARALPALAQHRKALLIGLFAPKMGANLNAVNLFMTRGDTTIISDSSPPNPDIFLGKGENVNASFFPPNMINRNLCLCRSELR